MKRFFGNVWGGASSFLDLSRGSALVDLLLLGGIAGMVFGLLNFSHEWTAQFQQQAEIDPSPWALPKYAFYSLSRGVIAYLFSLSFALVYGYWAAKDKTAQRVLLPLLDILQSLPVLAFLPVVLMTLLGLFKNSNIGLELVAIIMIFTGQAWNMTFSFFYSLNSIPTEQREAAAIYRFNWWERFKWMELPSATMGLVWNSMMSMAGGWFFLTICEAFILDGNPYRLPGIGAYMSVAVEKNDNVAKFWAIFAMTLMIVLLDQLLWRPIVVWAQKFRVEEGGDQETASSWFLDLLRRSRVLAFFGKFFSRTHAPAKAPARPISIDARPDINKPSPAARTFSIVLFTLLAGSLLWGATKLILLLAQVGGGDWFNIGQASVYTLLRVIGATILGTLWALPAGVAIGLSPKLSRILQPVVQVVASFPAPMLYTIVLGAMAWLQVTNLGFTSMILMLLGTQWYILFNVIAGAMAIPADLKEMSRSFGVTGWQRFWALYAPACFPYLVTGWVTAAGGAWNASIVAEYLKDKNSTQKCVGLGAMISEATGQAGQKPVLAACVVVMSAMVVLFNRFVWKRCYDLAQTRYSLSK